MVPFGNADSLVHPEFRSSVEVAESCNCTQCCPRTCCWPWGRKIEQHKHPERSEGHLDITSTGIRVVSASEPTLTASGQWEMNVDGDAQSVSAPSMMQHVNPVIDPMTITRTHTVSMPVLLDSGEWEVVIDGKKHSLSENPVGESIKQEHGIPK